MTRTRPGFARLTPLAVLSVLAAGTIALLARVRSTERSYPRPAPACPAHVDDGTGVPGSAAGTRAARGPYRLAALRVGGETQLLSLYRTDTGRPLWSRRVRGDLPEEFLDSVNCAPDGRALALEVVPPSSDRDVFLFWREGHRLWTCSRDPIDRHHDDWVFGAFVWSKDRSRVLFRAGSSGGPDLDVGALYCADLRERRLRLVADDAVRRMAWIDNHTLRYWTASLRTGNDEYRYVESPYPVTRRVR